MATIQVGDEAPNFDLSSTEDVLLMLRDEVVRTAQVLYFFAEDNEGTRRDLSRLAVARDTLAEAGARVMAVSPVKLDVLKAVQRELGLPFPLLHDDRGFSARYGALIAEGEDVGQPALVLVNRRQLVTWAAIPMASVDSAIPQIEAGLKSLPRPTDSLPSSVVNRWIDRLVN